MYKFSQQEWAALCAAGDRNFVLTVRDDIIRAYPSLKDDPHLSDSLIAAFDAARRLGLKDDARMVQFLWTQAHYPSLSARRAVEDWLSKKGKTVEERLDMLLAVMNAKVKQFNARVERS